MAIIIAKNVSGSVHTIDDLGIVISIAGQRTLTNECSVDEIDASEDLVTDINSADIVINDGSSDLSIADAIEHVKLVTSYEIEDGYYEKTDHIDTSAGAGDATKPVVTDSSGKIDISLIPADEITGSLEHHDLGGLGDDDHSQYHNDTRGDARYYTQSQIFTKTELGASGSSSVHWDNITNTPSFASVSWLEFVLCRVEEQSASGPGVPVDGMYYLDTDDDHLYKRVTGSWVDQGASSANDRFIDKSDEEVYEWSGSAWVVVAGPAEGDARIVKDDGDGGAAQYVFDGSNWIKFADVDWGDHGSLSGLTDDDHSQYHNDTRGDARYYQQSEFYGTSQGSQTPILTDSTGKIDVSFLPPSGETNVMVADFGRDRNNQDSQWLRNSIGSASNISGPRMPANATILGMSVQTRNSAVATFYIRKNGAAANLGNVALSSVSGNQTYALNISLSAGEFISLYMDVTSGNVDHPIVQIYYTWA